MATRWAKTAPAAARAWHLVWRARRPLAMAAIVPLALGLIAAAVIASATPIGSGRGGQPAQLAPADAPPLGLFAAPATPASMNPASAVHRSAGPTAPIVLVVFTAAHSGTHAVIVHPRSTATVIAAGPSQPGKKTSLPPVAAAQAAKPIVAAALTTRPAVTPSRRRPHAHHPRRGRHHRHHEADEED